MHIHFTNVQREATVNYMLVELFAQKTNSNSTKREMNCSKNCNSKLLPMSDKWDIYLFWLNGFPSWQPITNSQKFRLDEFGLCRIILCNYGWIDKKKGGKGFKRRSVFHINAKLWVKMLILDLLHPFITFCFLNCTNHKLLWFSIEKDYKGQLFNMLQWNFHH